MQIQTLEQAERYAASRGLSLTATDRKRIAAIQDGERERLQAIESEKPKSWVDQFNAFYPRLLESIIRAGEIILTFSQTVIVSLGVPLVLILLLVVEHHRVVEGIKLFDANAGFASFAALALVILNLVLEFQVHYVESAAGYQEERRVAWSARIALNNWLYRLGLGKTWQARELSPAARYRGLLRLVTITILALALVGSMRDVIAQTDGAWHTAIGDIIAESSLLLMMTWLGGLLFAAAAVLSAQGLSRYVAIRCVEIVATMQERQQMESDPHAAAIERAGATAALAIIQDKMNRREAKAAQAGSTAAQAAAPAGSTAAPAPLEYLEDDESEDDTAPANFTPALNGRH